MFQTLGQFSSNLVERCISQRSVITSDKKVIDWHVFVNKITVKVMDGNFQEMLTVAQGTDSKIWW